LDTSCKLAPAGGRDYKELGAGEKETNYKK